jgi:3-oxoacyl-[acyl-carrier protein] reductase
MKYSIHNQVAVVTGASRGIGSEIAFTLANNGAKIIVNYLQASKAAANIVRRIHRSGGEAIAVQGDVADREQVGMIFESTLKKFGHIDILINNAGHLEQKPFHLITDEDWDKTLNTNLKGTFLCSQLVAPYLKKRGGGCIINMASVGGQIGGDKAPHYAASKAGIISLTKSFARLLAKDNIRVNAISPGFIRTEMFEDIISRTPEDQINKMILMGRPGEVAEVADAVLFLVSDAASYITGHVLNVNGGTFL